MYVYKQIAPESFAVGDYGRDGEFDVRSIHQSVDEAARRAAEINCELLKGRVTALQQGLEVALHLIAGLRKDADMALDFASGVVEARKEYSALPRQKARAT